MAGNHILSRGIVPVRRSTPADGSVYITPPDEPRAISVDGVGDGQADDTDAVQQAIDKSADGGGGGIVFVPTGTYRLSRTIFLWPGVRIFGIGEERPVFLLGANTPGFDRGVANMLIFTGAKGETQAVPFPPSGSVPYNEHIVDANPGTFYSAISNINFRILEGNPAAAAVRFHAAQHAYVSHVAFDIGDGLAGLYQVANEAEDLSFRGGRYGILAEKTSPAWPFSLVDSRFEGQRDAAIREHEVGLTLVNVAIRDTPVGVQIDRGYGDWLWGQDVRFENISKAGVIISNENNVYTQVGFQRVFAANTPTFVQFRDSGTAIEGRGNAYKVESFTYGLTLPGLGQMGEYKTEMEAQAIDDLPDPPGPIIRPLPPVADWVSVRSLGAKGDNESDDTAAIQRAIDENRVVYLPAGFYIVTDTLHLQPDTVLLGLHPSLTQVILRESTLAFQGVGEPKALIETAQGGGAIVAGLGLKTNGINQRATALLWMAGTDSLVNDVKFQGGHGTFLFDGTQAAVYNSNGTGDPDPAKRWDGQYASLWITRGGGGTFANIWSPCTYAHPGILISDTDTPGRLIQASVEHHVRTEIGLNRVSNWELLAPQTEGEAAESRNAVSLEIRNSNNILIANYHGYRVTRTRKPVPAAVMLYNSYDIRFRNFHVNSESGLGTIDENGKATFLRVTKLGFENALRDVTHGLDVREREFAVLNVPVQPEAVVESTFENGIIEKLADGFFSLGGGAVDDDGTLYFIDRKFQRIWSWSDDRKLQIVRDTPIDPVNLTVDRSGNLLVLSSSGRNGTVYSFKPGTAGNELTVISPTPTETHEQAVLVLPVNWWNNGEFKDQINLETYEFTTLAEMFVRDMAIPKLQEYISLDGSIRLPASRVFQQGPPDFRAMRFSDSLDTYGFVQARVGDRVFLTNGSENKTYSGVVGYGGVITDLRIFTNRGGEGVTTDSQGRVYVANGQIFVYDASGNGIGRIDVPERPLQVVFGGPNKDILYILTNHTLYAWNNAWVLL